MGLILAETFNGLDAFHRKEARFFAGSSSFLGIIPNFFLGSQPSGIPLILHALPFCFQPIEAPYIVFYYYFFTHDLSLFLFCFSLFFFFVLSLLFFLFFKYGYKRGFSCFNLLPYPPSTYLLRHFRDCWLHQNDMSFKVYIELMGYIKETDIQWVVEWWHIARLVHSCCKDYCMPLVGLCCCLYYSTCRISRQFGECQRAFNDEGAFHTEVFTDRILGRFCEAWPRRRVTRGIAPPQYIYHTARYKQWLEDDMKWILRDEKAYMKTSKKARRIE